MGRTRLILRFVLSCVVGMVLLASSKSLAQTTDKIAQDLELARLRYEDSMNSTSDVIERVLNSELTAAMASKAKDHEALVAKAREAVTAFRSRGELPEQNKSKKKWEQQYAKDADGMSRAYIRAAGEYTKGTKDNLASIIDSESKNFLTQWDLLPWNPNLLADKLDEGRRIVPGKDLSVDPVVKGDYRLEIRGKRTGDAGTLLVELPVADGKRLSIPTCADDKGFIRVLVTVRGGLVSADAGILRPIDLEKATSGNSGNVTLRAEGGGLVIESVRAKPIVDGNPPDVADQVRKPANDKQPVHAADALQAGDVLSGETTINGKRPPLPLDGSVVRITEKEVVLRTKRVRAAGYIRWEFSRDGNSLTLIAAKSEGGEFSYKILSGSGSINGTTVQWSNKSERYRGVQRVDIGSATATLKKK